MLLAMPVALFRVQPSNVALLENVDPECFDEPIVMERAARCVASPDAVLVVAVADGLVVGQCLAAIHRHPDKPTELYIDDLAVAPSFRRQGVGRRLVEACLAHSRADGAEVVWVGTEPDNDVARSFYRSLRLTERVANVFERDLVDDEDSH